jgi:hypothetical protein
MSEHFRAAVENSDNCFAQHAPRCGCNGRPMTIAMVSPEAGARPTRRLPIAIEGNLDSRSILRGLGRRILRLIDAGTPRF